MFREGHSAAAAKEGTEVTCGCRAHNGFLTAKGLKEAAQRSLEGLDVAGMALGAYVDRVGSVSALVEVEIDGEYDPLHTELNHRLICNGA